MLKRRNVLAAAVSSLAALLGTGGVAAQPAEEIKNWPVPATTWTPTAAPVPETAALTPSLQFIGIAPCRLVDTRRTDLPTGYGKPEMSAGTARTLIMTGRPHCSISTAARAVSMNVTVVRPTGPGYLRLYPSGVTTEVASIVFEKDKTIANAAILPLGNDGGATFLIAFANAELVVDVNGYFAEPQTLSWRGAWNSSVPYAAGDLVSYAGSSWVSQIADNHGKVPTSNASAWNLVAQKGDAGATGTQGPPGPSPWPGKLCSILVGNTWRDTLPVPSTWTAATCERLMVKLGAAGYQLGCIFGNDFSFGQKVGGDKPIPNCGW